MVYAFDNCELDTQRIILRRAGQTTPLRPKVFQVLLHLLTHRERVVDKQELGEQVWPEQFISDATLESTIRAVRQAVGDSGKEQRIIQTLYGHGYRFVASVTMPAATREGDEEQARLSSSGPAEPLRRDPSEMAHILAAPEPALPHQPAALSQADQPPVIQHDETTRGDTPVTVPETSEAERRQLTIMFCDLADSTTLSGQLDPEDLYDVIRAYQDACAGVIQHFDGHIAQYLGDGLLVYFGYPLAHEDDARRAVQAGLGIIDVLAPLKTRLAQEKGVQLAVRVGIHTGLVVVGAIGAGERQEYLALGETPNLAARIQGLAAPDTLVISEATARLVHGFFICQSLEVQTLRGLAQPVTLYRVLGATEAQSRLDVVDPKGLTPLVGRHTEVSLLLERWAQVKEGVGHVVVLSGEAGIGKSRLVQVLKEHLVEEALTQLECRCSPYHQHSAWYPVVELLQRVFDWQPDETSEGKWYKLETFLAQCGLPLDETVPLFAALLSLPGIEARYPLRYLTPQQQRRKTLEAILAVVLALAARQPVLLMVDDLHWVDPSTLEVLTLLVEQTPTVPLYLVIACRPTFQVPWGSRSYMTQITLSRLPRAQVERMVTSLTGGKVLPSEVLRRVVDGTDGVPLFVEELTKAVLETGVLRDARDHYEVTAPLPTLAIPTTLHDSLMARLDHLGPAKSVAQLGAVLGRRFPYVWLHAAAQRDDLDLQRELGRLVEAELVYQQGFPPQATYAFKHALVQEAAYQSLVRNTRQHYHQRIAQVLVAQFPETVETQPELLAHHYTEAGLAAQAVPYWQQAGQRAIERSANLEAISHLTKGLEALKGLPPTAEYIQHELALCLALGQPLLMIQGQESPEVAQVYNRAQELCEQIGDSRQRFSVLMGLCSFYNAQGRLQTSRRMAEQLLTLAQGVCDPLLLLEAHLRLGSILFSLGEFVSARTHLEQGLVLHNRHQRHSVLLNTGVDSEVLSSTWLAWTLWMLGYPDRALAQSYETLHLAHGLSHPYTLAFALFFAAVLHMCCREAPCAHERLDPAMTLSREQGFVRWLAGCMMVRGWALAEQGALEEGIGQLEQGLAAWRALGGELALPTYLGMLAEAYGKVGRAHEGLRVLAEAHALVRKNTEYRFEAELFRIKGVLLLQASESASGRTTPPETAMIAEIPGDEATATLSLQSEAETCFRQALDVARHQQAKSLELRAGMSLARLWQAQGRHAEAHQMLAEIYGWFTEGFEVPDLREAKELLATLARTAERSRCTE
jgi:class 3 adenylate cyclase/DNA-binding winged helix-turn-helix (wHTH) protein/predicted ATPase